jgi:hypothetical protein
MLWVIYEIRTALLNITHIKIMLRGFNKFHWNTSFSVDENVKHCNMFCLRKLTVILTRQLHVYIMSVRCSTYNRCNMLVIRLEYSKAVPYSQVLRLNILILQLRKRLCIYSFL